MPNKPCVRIWLKRPDRFRLRKVLIIEPPFPVIGDVVKTGDGLVWAVVRTQLDEILFHISPDIGTLTRATTESRNAK